MVGVAEVGRAAAEGRKMTCREIADEFIIGIEWTNVSREESRFLVRMLEQYPFESFSILLGPFTGTHWIVG